MTETGLALSPSHLPGAGTAAPQTHTGAAAPEGDRVTQGNSPELHSGGSFCSLLGLGLSIFFLPLLETKKLNS